MIVACLLFQRETKAKKIKNREKKFLKVSFFFFVKSCLKLGRDSEFFSRERPNFKTKNTPKNNP